VPAPQDEQSDAPFARGPVAASGIAGALMLAAYFAAPVFASPLARVVYGAHPATAQVVAAGSRYHELLYAGSWLQATGALLAVMFFVALADMSSGTRSLAAKITQLGSAVLLAVVLAEVVFTYTWASSAVNGQVASSRTSFDVMSAVIRVFPIVPAPAIYLSLGVLLLATATLPRAFAQLALALGVAFAIAGLAGALLPAAAAATAALSGLQIAWIIAAAIALLRGPAASASAQPARRKATNRSSLR
jgi:hypothetical protein